MKTVFFYMFNAISHHFATFRLSHEFKKKGYRVVYGVLPETKDLVINEGFECYFIKKVLIAFPLREHVRDRKAAMNFEFSYLHDDMFSDIILEVNPSVFIIDTSFGHYSLDLIKFNIPVFIAQTMLPLEKRFNIPPLNSFRIPKNTVLSKIKAEAKWQQYFMRRLALDTQSSFELGTSERKLLKRKIRRLKFKKNVINFDRYLHYGFNVFPELVFPPRELDFPTGEIDNKIFIGSTKAISRKAQADHEQYYLEKVKLEKKPIVYCSLGTFSEGFFTKTFPFYDKLIEAFGKREHLNFIISIGPNIAESIDKGSYDSLPENVFMFPTVPQTEVLNKCVLMINHGGVNSITECILSEVPMIVFPLVSWVDENGNAARVFYHGIGLFGDMEKDSLEEIEHKIDLILNNSSFYRKISRIKNQIIENNSYHEVVSKIEEYIDRSGHLEKLEDFR